MIEYIALCLKTLREINPLVHNITNHVAMNSTANALLALGASPIMAQAPEEVADMVALSSSLVVNTGTLSIAQIESIEKAVIAANALKKPWVLDPVGAGTTPFRRQSNQKILQYKPAVVRGNASEIQALFMGEAGGKGVDSSQSPEATMTFLQDKALEHQIVIAVTGSVDLITDGTRLIRIRNGHSMMTAVTGMGCTATALIGAMLSVCETPWQAAISALACLSVAGEKAAKLSRGPGSLQVNLLDELYHLDDSHLREHLNIEVTFKRSEP